jgi:toxin-antitoxin system PIN domain toxin
MTVYLLDVNVLLALSDPMHLHHEAAHAWFAEKGKAAWATCPITENGFVRIASHPSYPNRPGDASMLLEKLRQFCKAKGHRFWSADVSIRALIQTGSQVKHSHITDVFLLGLAVHKKGMLATFDQRIPVTAVAGGTQALELLVPE